MNNNYYYYTLLYHVSKEIFDLMMERVAPSQLNQERSASDVKIVEKAAAAHKIKTHIGKSQSKRVNILKRRITINKTYKQFVNCLSICTHDMTPRCHHRHRYRAACAVLCASVCMCVHAGACILISTLLPIYMFQLVAIVCVLIRIFNSLSLSLLLAHSDTLSPIFGVKSLDLCVFHSFIFFSSTFAVCRAFGLIIYYIA